MIFRGNEERLKEPKKRFHTRIKYFNLTNHNYDQVHLFRSLKYIVLPN